MFRAKIKLLIKDWRINNMKKIDKEKLNEKKEKLKNNKVGKSAS